MTYTPIRYQQRFQNFEKSYRLFEKIATIPNPSEGERIGLVQVFEMCFELAWKTMKDYLEYKGFLVSGPRDVIKQAFQEGYITDGTIWLAALESRNETSHVYDESKALIIEQEILQNYRNIFKNFYETFAHEIQSS